MQLPWKQKIKLVARKSFGKDEKGKKILKKITHNMFWQKIICTKSLAKFYDGPFHSDFKAYNWVLWQCDY
jgi:hypothetical protein